ncbi:MAG: alpha/beta fold hydrolase [Gammaproteobacteria bacterium]|jgi:pimeloyl-ACP methyl ester carboxylesterase
MDARTPDPAALADQLHARCRKIYTPCGEGRMVWRVWGTGEPVVLLHGGSGSWTHWMRNIPVLERRYTLYVADLPGLGDSDMPPKGYDPTQLVESTDHIAEIVVEGLRELLPPPIRYHLVGFSFGAVSGGYVAAREGARIRSFTTIGAAALGVPWPGLTGTLRAVTDGMTDAEVFDVQRHNLNVIMMAAQPSEIDDFTAWLQLENTKRARIRTHTVASSDTLLQALRRAPAPLTAIWGAQDVFLKPGVESRERVLRPEHPEVAIHVVDGAGHWAMYEAAERINALLLGVFAAHGEGG